MTAETTNPAFQATPLLYTFPGRETWLEDETVRDPQQTVADLYTSRAVRERKQYTDAPRPVAAIVAEGGTGRAVVFGSGYVFTDAYAARGNRGGAAPPTFDLIAVSIDWLRDRPPLPTTVATKTYQEYTFPDPATVDTTRLLYLPLGLTLLVVGGLGAGVWVIRRK